LIFEPTLLPGAWIVRPERRRDERGSFARVWCRDEFAAHGVDIDMPQASVSTTERAGTVRGLHFAWPPTREGKLVRCERGRVFDVAVDLRPRSATFLRHLAITLDADEASAVDLPPGIAPGFQTLVAGSTVLYMMSERYHPELGDGVRHDDPAFAVRWPLPVTLIAERDRSYPDFDRERHTARFDAVAVH
jgi:dTDP-4-dehydrorhamnose 3,5-epimerase